MTEEQRILYRVTFQQDSKVYEVYARYISEETIIGFLEIEALVFGDPNSSVVVDPQEEKLRQEFKGVKRSYVPIHLVLRIDEVDDRGTAKIRRSQSDSNVSPFPGAFVQAGIREDMNE